MTEPTCGVMFPCRLPPGELVGLVRAAEQAGLDEVWLVEDCFFAGALASMATALAATERITVGIGILPAVARNPAFAAMELATLAELHPGRVIGGIGHGMPDWMRQIGSWPASPLAALEETLRAVRGLLAGELVSLQGRHVSLREVRLEFPPAVVPPVLAGVRGPRSLEAAGRSADGTILAEPTTPEYLRYARKAIGVPRDAHPVVAYNWFAPDADHAAARERLGRQLAATLGPANESALAPLPFGAELLDVLAANPGPDRLAAALRPDWVDRLGVLGDQASCAAGVRELWAAGADSVVLVPLPGAELRSVWAAGELRTRLRTSAT